MKVRLMGTKGECEVAAQLIGRVLTVLEASEPRANRGESVLVRQYLEVRIPGTAPAGPEALPAPPPARPGWHYPDGWPERR